MLSNNIPFEINPDDDTDDDESKKKLRITFTMRQLVEFERNFKKNKYLSSTQMTELASSLSVTPLQVVECCYSSLDMIEQSTKVFVLVF